MIRFGVFILLVFVGTELSAFSHQATFDPGGGKPADEAEKLGDLKKAAQDACTKFNETPTQENLKDALSEISKLQSQDPQATNELMTELLKEVEKKASKEAEEKPDDKNLKEKVDRLQELFEMTQLLGPEKTTELRDELIKQVTPVANALILKSRNSNQKEPLDQAVQLLTAATGIATSEEQRKLLTGNMKSVQNLQNAFGIGQAVGLGNYATWARQQGGVTLNGGGDYLSEIPTGPGLAKNSGGGPIGGGSGGSSATSFRNNSSSGTPAETPSHSPDAEQGSTSSQPTQTETNSSGSGATSSKPSAATPPSSSSGGGVASAVTPSATPTTPSPAPATGGQSSSPQSNLAKNAVIDSSAGRGTAPATQPHGAPISKNPSAETGETKPAKKSTGSNSDSDVGSILGRVPLGASGMPQTVAAGSVPRMRRENSAGTTTAEPLATAGGERNQKSGNRPGDPVQPTNVYSVRDKDLRPGGTTGEGLTKNTGQPTSSVKIADNATDTSASGDNNQSSPVTSTSNQGKPSYNWRENGRELQPLATNDLKTNELRVAPLEARGLAVNSLNTNDNPAPNTAGEKSQNSQNNSIVGQQEKLALYTNGLAQDALMVAALGSPTPRGNPKTTGGLTQFAATNTDTGITMPSITDGTTAARGLVAAKAKTDTSKKTGVAAQAPNRSIAAVTPKASTGFVVRGFRELRGFLGAR